MSKLFVPLSSSEDWRRLLAEPDLHWVPGYSAMCTSAAWQDCADKLPAEIRAVLDASGDPRLVGLELLLAIPEWKVPLKGGVRASQTDVLAVCRNQLGLVVIGVEAKVDEPFGPTVGEKRRVESNGQAARLAFLESELQLRTPLPDDISYQLVHRTVAAILTARAFHAGTAVMMVQSFSPTRKWRGSFDRFAAILEACVVKDGVALVPRHAVPVLFLGWCSGDQRFRSVDLRDAVGSQTDVSSTITDDELRSVGFHRAGTVYPDSDKAVRVEITSAVSGHVVYMMKVKNEVKKVGITGTGASGFKNRMMSTFSALRGVMNGPRPNRPLAGWRSRKLDPFKENAASSIQAGHEIELWAMLCASLESMKAKETELNNKYRPQWTKEGRRAGR